MNPVMTASLLTAMLYSMPPSRTQRKARMEEFDLFRANRNPQLGGFSARYLTGGIDTKPLYAERKDCAEKAGKILVENTRDGKALTGEKRAEWEKLMNRVDELGATIEAAQRQQKLDDAMQEVRNDKGIGRQGAEQTPDAAAKAERYQKCFRNFIRQGPSQMTADEVAEVRTWLDSTTAFTGISGAGALVPQGFYAAIANVMKSFAGPRQAPCTFLETDMGNDIPLPVGDDTANTGELLGENAQTAGGDGSVVPTLKSVGLKAYMFSSKVLPVPIQLIQDSGIDSDAYLTSRLGERLGRIQNTYFTTGSGNSQPMGIVTAVAAVAGQVNTTASGQTNTLIYDDIFNTEHKTDPAYRAEQFRNDCGFMLNDDTLRQMKLIKDSLGRPIWRAGMSESNPDTLDGYKYYIGQGMDTLATATGNVLLFGNWKYFVIRDVKGVVLMRLTERYADYFQVGFLAFERSDSRCTNPAAFGLCKLHS